MLVLDCLVKVLSSHSMSVLPNALTEVLRRHSPLPYHIRPSWSERVLIKARHLPPISKSNTVLWRRVEEPRFSEELVKRHRALRLKELLPKISVVRSQHQVHWRSAEVH